MATPNLTHQPVRAVPKPQHKRITLTRRQRSELSAREVTRLHERSGGVCERCDRQRATEKAHIERRWRSEDKPTAEDVAHLCTLCHRWADSCKEGRTWLIEFQQQLVPEFDQFPL